MGFLRDLKPIKLELGHDYLVHWGLREPLVLRFIQPTAKRYNFLNLETSKCILKRHLYPNAHYSRKGDNWFMVPKYLNIRIDEKR
jgi:hypothetical protein